MGAWIDQNETSITLARSEAIRLTQAAFDAAGIAAPLPGYRIENLPDALNGAKPAKSKSAKTSAPAPAPAHDVDAKADKELEKIVDQERAELERSDLLNLDASEE